jgi:hypothetical protein
MEYGRSDARAAQGDCVGLRRLGQVGRAAGIRPSRPSGGERPRRRRSAQAARESSLPRLGSRPDSILPARGKPDVRDPRFFDHAGILEQHRRVIEMRKPAIPMPTGTGTRQTESSSSDHPDSGDRDELRASCGTCGGAGAARSPALRRVSLGRGSRRLVAPPSGYGGVV